MILFPTQIAIPSHRCWICKSCRSVARPSARYSQQQGAVKQRIQPHRLPTSPARTRFAPSPTGYLHLGSLRTALFNYLLAKATGGQFLLRIEDTDQKRTIPDAEERLCQDLEWAGLHWDEGPNVGGLYGPYRQSQRTTLYQDHARKLLESGHAYRCFCSSDRLHELAKQRRQLGLPIDYDRTCAGISREESEDRASKGELYITRLKMPDIYPKFEDIIYGSVGKPNLKSVFFKHGEAAYEDPVLIKSDGLPTYHLANVVDDHHMKITHVVRAAEWMSSTPKHIVMYNAFGWEPPAFAHVGLLQNDDRQKLSKRNMDLDIGSLRENGIFPEALVNFVALLGWSHSRGNDFMTLKDLEGNFDLKFTKGNTIVNPAKLNFLQKKHAQIIMTQNGPSFEPIIDQLLAVVQANPRFTEDRKEIADDDPIDGRGLRQYAAAVLRAGVKQYTTVPDFYSDHRYFFLPLWGNRSSGVEKVQNNEDSYDDCIAFYARHIADLSPDQWTTPSLTQKILDISSEIPNSELAKKLRAKAEDPESEPEPGGERLDEKGLVSLMDAKAAHGALCHWLRWAILGGDNGPGMADTMALLGRRISLCRLHAAASMIKD